MRPRIALNCDIRSCESDETERAKGGAGGKLRSGLYLDYIDFVVAAGGTPLLLPPASCALPLLDDVDGLILTGGADYRLGNDGGEAPPRFVPVDERREAFDIELAREALRRDLPLLGICGGFQLMVLVEGGGLHGDLETEIGGAVPHRKEDEDDPIARHGIEWTEVFAPLGVDRGRLDVNSQHHQGVRELPPAWSALAHTDDGLLEAAAGPGRFQLAVQWHPERDRGTLLTRRLGEALVGAASRFHGERGG
ncbi:MAG: gamma-glutamyl-gamma-aminobutyrate hydrolase family protein [Planctomycetota bacterium]